jgi:uncharacterized damage-inducible protein DinB
MIALRNSQTLVRYSAWANSLLYAAVVELPEAELLKMRQTVFGNMLRTLSHVYAMDLVWQAHLQGKQHGFTSRGPNLHLSLADLRAAQTKTDQWFVRYTDELQAPLGAEVVKFTFIGGGEGAITRDDILMHVVNHTTYHRGHIVAMMNQIPAPPPTTELPVFLRSLQ